MNPQICLLGLGAMGERMARRLLSKGRKLTVWNRHPARAEALLALGARVAPSPREAVTEADIVISMVRDDEASRRVWLDPTDGALEGLPDHAIAIESSTLSLPWLTELNRAFLSRNRRLLDAPVLGSRPQAETGQLIHLVGGAHDDVEGVRAVLAELGTALHHVGAVGSGAALKLIVNGLFAVQVAAVAEALGLASRLGLNTQQVAETIGMTPVCSLAAKGAMASMVHRDFAPMFPLELVAKDLGYHRCASQSHDASTPMTDAARQLFANALARKMGDDNLTGIIQLYVQP